MTVFSPFAFKKLWKHTDSSNSISLFPYLAGDSWLGWLKPMPPGLRGLKPFRGPQVQGEDPEADGKQLRICHWFLRLPNLMIFGCIVMAHINIINHENLAHLLDPFPSTHKEFCNDLKILVVVGPNLQGLVVSLPADFAQARRSLQLSHRLHMWYCAKNSCTPWRINLKDRSDRFTTDHANWDLYFCFHAQSWNLSNFEHT